MRYVAALGLVVMAGGIAAAQVTGLEAPGNLAATRDPGCVAVGEADPGLSPPDLGLGVLACAKAGNWDLAADLYILMRMRADFDQRRVTDATAHQGAEVLAMHVGESLAEPDRAELGAALSRFGVPGDARHAAFCQAVAAGVPSHDPTWMLQHGMGAFLGTEGDGLVPGFDPKVAWDSILTDDLQCP